MDTHMNTPLTLKEYADSHGLSITTVRRRIRAGKLDARLEHGRYFIYNQNGDYSKADGHSKNGKEDVQSEQPNDQEYSQVPHSSSQESSDQQPLIDRLTSEVDYLRDQLDKQTQLLAASTAQNSHMVAKLNPPAKPSWVERVRERFSKGESQS